MNGDYGKARAAAVARPGGAAQRAIPAAIGARLRAQPARAEPEDVDGPGAGPDGAQAVAHGPGRATRVASRAAASRSSPSARCAASVEECVQPEPWAAPSG